MAEKTVEVPQSDLDAVEQARKDLYALFEELGHTDLPTIIRLNNITAHFWKVGNKKYPPIYDLRD